MCAPSDDSVEVLTMKQLALEFIEVSIVALIVALIVVSFVSFGSGSVGTRLRSNT